MIMTFIIHFSLVLMEIDNFDEESLNIQIWRIFSIENICQLGKIKPNLT